MSTITAIRGDDGNDAGYRHNLMRGAAAQLSEHFDSVLIITTVNDTNGGTHMLFTGNGNQYAAIASAERFVIKEKAKWGMIPP